MQITIIKADNFVSIDGVQKEMDLSFLPDDFHALQFDGSKGSVESNDIDKCAEFDSITKWSNWTEFDSKAKGAKNVINPAEIVEPMPEPEVAPEPEPEPEVELVGPEPEPVPEPEEEPSEPIDPMEVFRMMRDAYLSESDVLVLRALEQGLTVDSKIVQYRQKLRDLPSQIESGKIAKPTLSESTEGELVFNGWPTKPF